MRSRSDTIDVLLLVAGASCSGKTTFIETLRNPAGSSRLPAELEALQTADCAFLDAIAWSRPVPPAVDRPIVCLHYDIFRPITFQVQSYAADPALCLLEKARHVAAITLWEPPRVLAGRNRARRRRLWRALLHARSWRGLLEQHGQYRAKRRRRRIMQPWLDDPRRLWMLYAQWLDFCRTAGVVDHWMARTANGTVFTPVGNTVPEAPPWSASDPE